MLDSERTFKIKVKSNIFLNFAYVRKYLHLKSFTWKRDCPISSKLQTSQVDQGHSKKLLQSSTRVSLPHFLHGFWRNLFLWLCSIDWPDFIAFISWHIEHYHLHEKISATSLAKRSTILAVFVPCFQYLSSLTRWENKKQNSNFVAEK